MTRTAKRVRKPALKVKEAMNATATSTAKEPRKNNKRKASSDSTSTAKTKKKRPSTMDANSLRKQNNAAAESRRVVTPPAMMIAIKKRKVIPFAIPSRGDLTDGEPEAVIRVVIPVMEEEEAPMPSPTASSRAKTPPKKPSQEDATQAEGPSQQWTVEEDKILTSSLAAGKTHREIGEILGRSIYACQSRVRRLNALSERGSHSNERPRWTDEEDSIIQESHSKGMPWADIVKLVPRHSYDACRNRLYKLQGKRNTEEEKDDTEGSDGGDKDNSNSKPPPSEPKESEPEKRKSSRRNSAKVNQDYVAGIEIASRPASWEEKEDKILAEAFKESLSWNAIVKLLPGRTIKACRCRLVRLGFSSTSASHPSNDTTE